MYACVYVRACLRVSVFWRVKVHVAPIALYIHPHYEFFLIDFLSCGCKAEEEEQQQQQSECCYIW